MPRANKQPPNLDPNTTYVAWQSFAVEVDGYPIDVQKGTRLRGDHPTLIASHWNWLPDGAAPSDLAARAREVYPEPEVHVEAYERAKPPPPLRDEDAVVCIRPIAGALALNQTGIAPGVKGFRFTDEYGDRHVVIAGRTRAFVRGVGARLYSIDNVVDRTTKRHWYRYTSHQRTAEPESPSVRLAVGGTGGIYLASKDRSWGRALLSLVNAHDRGKVSDHVIADQLARLNYETHQAVRDNSVGPKCIVVWRRRPDARTNAPGGSHRCYTGTDRDNEDSATIPTIANGMDVQGIAGVLVTQFQARLASHGLEAAFNADIDKDKMNRLLAELPSEPDETLR